MQSTADLALRPLQIAAICRI